MEPIPDFTQRRSFPGTEGNDFDTVLRRAEDVEKIPALLFAGLLLLIALPPTWGRWAWTAGLWAFFLGDWLLLWLLPRMGKSFGPPRPTVIILSVLRMLFAFLPLVAALPLEIIGTLLVIYGFWIEPHRLTVTHQKITSPKLKAGAPPIRVLHLGDLHIEHSITERERRLNRLIEELQPDLILFSGDVINLSYIEDPRAWKVAREIMGQWQARCGVYVVTGSPAVDLAHVFPHLVEGLPLTWLNDQIATVEINGQAIDVVGITCTHKPFVDGPRLESLLEAHPSDHFTILLHHTPDLAPNAANTGKIDLQFSGHTHGGQIRLPLFGAPFAASLYGKRFESGRRQVGNLTLYVTRGMGMEGKAAPRVRVLCPPEIILWEIEGAG